jgi:hypothetical protein
MKHLILFGLLTILVIPINVYGGMCDNKRCCADKNCSECIPGVYGNKCTIDCPSVCQGVCHRSCNKTNGDCEYCADKQKWGYKCQHKCNDNCQLVEDDECSSYLVCNTTNGHCFKCAPEKWGQTCQHSCNCSNLGCDDKTGTCISPSTSKKDFPYGLAIAGVVAGFILLIIIIGCFGMCCPGSGCGLQPIDFNFSRYSRPVTISHGAGNYTTTTAYGTYGSMTSVSTGNGSTTLVNNHQIQNV